MRALITLALFAFLSVAASAAELRGIVKSYSTGKAIVGATVEVPALDLKTVTDSKGRFWLQLPAGEYAIRLSQDGYHSYTYSQAITDGDKTVKVALELKPSSQGETTPEALGETPQYDIDEVTVLTTRASADHPVTFNNLTRAEVNDRNYGQDLPLLITDMPNVTSYSDGASGIGYSYLKMRGFTQNRVAVELNGTPLNDAESHEVFWIDLPDFASDVQDIQVQRGVGSSLYGPAAFGGTVNVVTKTPGLSLRPLLRAETSLGSWNTRRAMLSFESGRVQNKYGFAGRLTRMSTEGYRDGAWAKLWSYYLSACRFSAHHTTRLVFYGGPEQTHLAYNGIPKDSLNTNRRYNPISYAGEIDNFFQPHYELHDEWKISSNLNFDNTFYLFRGDGYYDQWRPGTKVSKIFYSDTTDNTFDLLKRRNIGESDWGWIPRAEYDFGWLQSTLGGEMRMHQAHHEGLVLWGSTLPAGTPPDYHFYDYRIRKQSFSGYLHNIGQVTSRLRVMLDLQAQSQSYKMDRDRLFAVNFDKSFRSFSPRLGANYQLIEPNSKRGIPAGAVYANFSTSQREPAVSNLFDAQDYSSLPISVPQRFRNGLNGGTYNGPSLKPEKLTDIEAGTNWQWINGRIGINYYWMMLRDEIIPYAGQIDDNGVPVSGNADKTLHQGVEIVAVYSPVSLFTFSGNLALTDHHFVNYKEWDWSLNDYAGGFVSRDGNRLAQDPAYIGNLRAEFSYRDFNAALSLRTQGKQYLDNSENKDSAVPAYALLNLDLSYRFTFVNRIPRALELKLRVNNLLDKEYTAFGYSDYDDGTPRYIVGAPRSAYATLAVEI
jgi:iron complex outermembrane receptor protein